MLNFRNRLTWKGGKRFIYISGLLIKTMKKKILFLIIIAAALITLIVWIPLYKNSSSKQSAPTCVTKIEEEIVKPSLSQSPQSIVQIAEYREFTKTQDALTYLKSKEETLIFPDGSSIYPELILRDYDNQSSSFNEKMVDNTDIVVVFTIINYTDSETVFHASPVICIDGNLTQRAKKILYGQ